MVPLIFFFRFLIKYKNAAGQVPYFSLICDLSISWIVTIDCIFCHFHIINDHNTALFHIISTTSPQIVFPPITFSCGLFICITGFLEHPVASVSRPCSKHGHGDHEAPRSAHRSKDNGGYEDPVLEKVRQTAGAMVIHQPVGRNRPRLEKILA